MAAFELFDSNIKWTEEPMETLVNPVDTQEFVEDIIDFHVFEKPLLDVEAVPQSRPIQQHANEAELLRRDTSPLLDRTRMSCGCTRCVIY